MKKTWIVYTLNILMSLAILGLSSCYDIKQISNKVNDIREEARERLQRQVWKRECVLLVACSVLGVIDWLQPDVSNWHNKVPVL
jgi:hypothetical protein